MKKLKPRKDNITITGAASFEKQLKNFGNALAGKLEKIIRAKVGVLLMDIKEGNTKRLVLCVCEGNLQQIEELLKVNFDLHNNNDDKKPCLRIWGFPMEFISPQAQSIKGEWKEMFHFSARIDKDATLNLMVSSTGEDGTYVDQFREKLQRDFSTIGIRNKQKPRRGKDVPGFVMQFPVGIVRGDNQQPAGGGSAEQQKVVQQFSVRALSKHENKNPHLPIQTVLATQGVPAEELLKLVFAHLPETERLGIIKSLLPKGVGLYNTEKPLLVDEGSAKVNLI